MSPRNRSSQNINPKTTTKRAHGRSCRSTTPRINASSRLASLSSSSNTISPTYSTKETQSLSQQSRVFLKCSPKLFLPTILGASQKGHWGNSNNPRRVPHLSTTAVLIANDNSSQPSYLSFQNMSSPIRKQSECEAKCCLKEGRLVVFFEQSASRQAGHSAETWFLRKNQSRGM